MPTSDMSTGGEDAVSPYTPYSVQVAEIIRGKILGGQYASGERLNEVALASSLGISRSPIREALRHLAKEGLVDLVGGRGAFVASLPADEVNDLLEIREALDALAARLAAQRATDDQLDELEHELLDYTARLHQPDPATFSTTEDFHLGIYRAAGNGKLTELGLTVHTQLRLVRFRSGASQDRADQAHEEHLEIMRALRRHDPDEAERRTREHLSVSRTYILAVLEEERSKAATGSANTPREGSPER